MSEITSLTKDMLSSSISEVALAWARNGFAILAVWGVRKDGACGCGRVNCDSPGKHPISALFRKGHLSATLDEKLIRRAFSRYPNANLGIVPPQGYVFVDVDGSTGEASFAKLGLPQTANEKTGRGKHYLFRVHDMVDRPPKLPGIDLKTSAGYVVSSPSTHSSGRRYRWSPKNLDIAAISASDLKISTKRLVDFEAKTGAFKRGNRNNQLTSVAGFLRSKGIVDAALERALAAINDELCTPPLPNAEVRAIARSIGKYANDAEEAFMSLSDIEEKDVEFLIEPYLVKGAVNVLDGNMGEGKSTFTCAVAAAVTTGKALPFAKSMEQGDVLVLSAEDDPARVLKPRMVKYGADVSRIRFQNAPFTLDDRGMELLRRECEQNKPLLIIIDPVIAYMAEDVDGNSANDTMRFIVKLDYLAREFKCCILLVRHFRKAKSDTPMHRGVGSIALSARVRSALMLGRHPDHSDLRIVAHSKHNYSKKAPSLILELRDEEQGKPPTLVWHDPDPNLDEYDIVEGRSGAGRPDKERELAKSFLRIALAKGPVMKSKIDIMAGARSITEITLRRAAEEMQIVKGKEGRRSTWSLPEG